jgi:hypothetical protein
MSMNRLIASLIALLTVAVGLSLAPLAAHATLLVELN